jgi:hypothetical protein
LWFANAGDSRTILVKKESVVQVTTDHKPDEPKENARILAAGGSISFHGVWRVNGIMFPLHISSHKPVRIPTLPQANLPFRVDSVTVISNP